MVFFALLGGGILLCDVFGFLDPVGGVFCRDVVCGAVFFFCAICTVGHWHVLLFLF